jgi:hypothetical protein
MATTDKDRVERHKEEATVVFDESLKGKTIDAIDGKAGIDFKDQGRMSVIPRSSINMMCPGQKVPSEKYKKRYDEVAWHCAKCDRMHTEAEGCDDDA